MFLKLEGLYYGIGTWQRIGKFAYPATENGWRAAERDAEFLRRMGSKFAYRVTLYSL
jgi:hypothetical protein